MRPIATTRMAAGIPTGRLAIWWVVASEIVIFGGLLVSYIMHRLAKPEWGDHAAKHQRLDWRLQHIRAADLEPFCGVGPQGRGQR